MIGRTVSHYRILDQLGAGGMGVVYSAEDVRLGRQVALKFVSDYLAGDQQALLRLRSEARAASALNHPNICTIYDIGEADGHPFIVMEMMKGQTLRDRLLSGPLKPAQVVDLGVEIADALHAAHAEGIIHRDIKPGNIFLTERGHAKILDFGLAKLTPRLSTSATTGQAHASASGVTHGTTAYMSPEQATGETLDERTDLFSLGLVLYECATGRHPFPGKTAAVVIAAILDRIPPPPLAWNADVPLRLNEIIVNCLEKDRELRYQSAADLRADLKRLRRDLDSGLARPIDPGAADWSSRGHRAHASNFAVTPPTDPQTEGRRSGSSRLADLSDPPSRRAALFWAGAGALGMVVAAALVLPAVRQQNISPPPAPAAADSPAVPPPEVRREPSPPSAPAAAPAAGARSTPSGRDEATLARFDRAIADARRRLGAGDYSSAARSLEEARRIDGASPIVVELSSRLAQAIRERDARRRPPAVTAEREPVPEAPAPQKPAPTPSIASPPTQQLETTVVPPPINTSLAPAVKPSPTPPTPAPGTEPAPAVGPKPPSAAAKTDEASIREIIAAYGRAIEQKDIDLFRSVKPNLTREEERRLLEGFRAVNTQEVTLTVTSLARDGDRASAVVERLDVIEAGGRRRTSRGQQVFAFSRTKNGWTIVEIR